MAKHFIAHPDDNYREQDALLVRYFKDCMTEEDGQKIILPKPHFLKLIQGKVLNISGMMMQPKICYAIKNMLIEAEQRKIDEF